MNEAIFSISKKKAIWLLKKAFFLKKDCSEHRLTKLIPEGISKDADYITTYKIILQYYNFDVLLYDDSFLQFEFVSGTPVSLRYAYYQSPYEFPAYEDYLLQLGWTYDNVGEQLRDEYEQELSEAQTKDIFSPLRYEFDISQYTPTVHAASHLHIGFNNDIRIPVSRFITPHLFVLFVLKHQYYKRWKKLITSDFFNKCLSTAKVSCDSLKEEYFSNNEKNELYLI